MSQRNPADPAEAGSLPLEMDVAAARRLLSTEEPPVLLDVREAWERDIVHLGEGIHLPLGQLGQRWGELPRDKLLLVYCHHGVRSLHAVSFLRENGFPLAQSLRGGIDLWAEQCEPGMARY
jgi:rhodanese-related sulfurtransferase